MTTKGRKVASGKRRVKELRIRKETLKDLDAKTKASKVKGGTGGLLCPTRYEK